MTAHVNYDSYQIGMFRIYVKHNIIIKNKTEQNAEAV